MQLIYNISTYSEVLAALPEQDITLVGVPEVSEPIRWSKKIYGRPNMAFFELQFQYGDDIYFFSSTSREQEWGVRTVVPDPGPEPGPGGDYYTKPEVDALLRRKQNTSPGKGLSTNDYTTADKDKVDALPYQVFTPDADGLVPSPGEAITGDLRTLHADGTWRESLGEAATFVATYGDTAYSEITAALSAGKAIIVRRTRVVSGTTVIDEGLLTENTADTSYVFVGWPYKYAVTSADAWSVAIMRDDVPTEGSDNLMTSGDIWNALQGEGDTRYVVTFTLTTASSSSTITCDRTNAEIYAAKQAGKSIVGWFEQKMGISTTPLNIIPLTLDNKQFTNTDVSFNGLWYGPGTVPQLVYCNLRNNTAKYSIRKVVLSDGDGLGNTITSTLLLDYDITNEKQAVPRKYVDDRVPVVVEVGVTTFERCAELHEAGNYLIAHCVIDESDVYMPQAHIDDTTFEFIGSLYDVYLSAAEGDLIGAWTTPRRIADATPTIGHTWAFVTSDGVATAIEAVDKVFVAIYGHTTFAEIISAANADMIVIAKKQTVESGVTVVSDGLLRKSAIDADPAGELIFDAYPQEFHVAADDTWTTADMADHVPTANSTKLITSGATHAALELKQDAEAGKGLSTNDYTDADKAKVDNIPTKTSDLVNDLNFQTEAEVDQKIEDAVAGIVRFEAKKVTVLPAVGESHVIYLVPDPDNPNVSDEFIWIAGDPTGHYEEIGKTEVDLSDYYTISQTDTLLANKVDKVTGKGLSTNDYTGTDKDKVDAIPANPAYVVKVDGTALTPDANHAVDITTSLLDVYTKAQVDADVDRIYDSMYDRRRVLHILVRKNNDSGQFPMGWVAIVTANTRETFATFCTWLYSKGYTSPETSYGFTGGCCGTTAVRNSADTGTTYIGRVTSGAYSTDGTSLCFKYDYNGTVTGIAENRCVVISFPLS